MYRKDYRLFVSLLLWSLVPSLYLLVRMNIVSLNGVNIDILGQMEWFDLIDEVIVTALTVPLYFLLKKNKTTPQRNGLAFVISLAIYGLFTVLVSLNISRITAYMQAEYAMRYLFLQSISMLVGFISSFMVLLFSLDGDDRTIRILLLAKVILLSVFDYVLISRFNDLGAVYSEILVNVLLAAVSFAMAYAAKHLAFGRCDISWIKEWFQKGLFSAMQIFLDNYVYAIMVVKMVNAVARSGDYWVANNFIWGWLLVPVHALAEIIRKNHLEKLDMANTWRYALIIIACWLITMPGWPHFIAKAMAVDPYPILQIIYPNIIFYLAYVVSVLIDAWLISRGKTVYSAVISLFVNIVYYGLVYIGFRNGSFEADMTFIIMMFGFGNVVHMILSVIMYRFERNRDVLNAKSSS